MPIQYDPKDLVSPRVQEVATSELMRQYEVHAAAKVDKARLIWLHIIMISMVDECTSHKFETPIMIQKFSCNQREPRFSMHKLLAMVAFPVFQLVQERMLRVVGRTTQMVKMRITNCVP